jgi:hypothetical protein
MGLPTRRTNSRLPARIALRSLLAVALTAIGFAALAAPAGAVPKSFFGVSAVQPSAADFKRMGEVGVGTVRIEIAWGAVQSEKNAPYNWNVYDQRFRRAAAYGVRPQPILFGSPPHISGGDYGHVVAPVDRKSHREAWQKFVTAAADRYGPGGTFWLTSPTLDGDLAPKDWIIWNEQNARNFWHPSANPKEYARLLRLSREALDAAADGLEITTGGMYGFPKKGTSIPAVKYLKRLYKEKRMTKVIDAVSLHPYSSGIGGVKDQIKDARKVMDRAGARNAQIVIGEIGWASGGEPKNNFLIKTKSRQRALLERAFRLFLDKRKSWNIRNVYWFTFRDHTADVCIWCAKAGLLNQKGKLKPAGESYKGLVQRHTP